VRHTALSLERTAQRTVIDVRATHSIEPGTWDEIWQFDPPLLRHRARLRGGQYQDAFRRIVLVRSRVDRTLVGLVSLEVLPFVFEGRFRLAVIYTSQRAAQRGVPRA